MSVVAMAVLNDRRRGHTANLVIRPEMAFLETLLEVGGRDLHEATAGFGGAWRAARLDLETGQPATLYRPVPWNEHGAEADAERAPNLQVLAELSDTEAIDWMVTFDPDADDVADRRSDEVAVLVRRTEWGTTLVVPGERDLHSPPVRSVDVGEALLYHTATGDLPGRLSFVADRAPAAAYAALTGPLTPIGPEGAMADDLTRDLRPLIDAGTERAVLERLLQTADERLRPRIFARLGGRSPGAR